MGSDVPRDHLHSISSPGDMADMYPDSGVPEEHMKYSHLQMESDQKLIKFMGGPMQRGLKGVPGVGDATIEKLKQLEIFTLDQLMGKFMSFDRDCARMLIWLGDNECCGNYAETCVHALAMKLYSVWD